MLSITNPGFQALFLSITNPGFQALMLRSDGIERSGLLVFDDCLDKFSSIFNILAAGGLKQFQFVNFLLVFRVVHIKALKQFPAVYRTISFFEAAAQLQRADYYRWVFDNKPGWQKI